MHAYVINIMVVRIIFLIILQTALLKQVICDLCTVYTTRNDNTQFTRRAHTVMTLLTCMYKPSTD